MRLSKKNQFLNSVRGTNIDEAKQCFANLEQSEKEAAKYEAIYDVLSAAQSPEMIDYLVDELGVDLKSNQYYKDTPPLIYMFNEAPYAISKGFIEKLVAKGANVNAMDKDGKTALHYAILPSSSYFKAIDVVKQLVYKGADVNAADKDGKTPLMYAARAGDQEVFEFLIAKKATIVPDLLSNAIYGVNHSIVERVFALDKENATQAIKKDGFKLLNKACMLGAVDIANTLLSKVSSKSLSYVLDRNQPLYSLLLNANVNTENKDTIQLINKLNTLEMQAVKSNAQYTIEHTTAYKLASKGDNNFETLVICCSEDNIKDLKDKSGKLLTEIYNKNKPQEHNYNLLACLVVAVSLIMVALAALTAFSTTGRGVISAIAQPIMNCSITEGAIELANALVNYFFIVERKV